MCLREYAELKSLDLIGHQFSELWYHEDSAQKENGTVSWLGVCSTPNCYFGGYMCCVYVVLIVHRLRPGDIDVVAALGDSATVSSTVLLSLTS